MTHSAQTPLHAIYTPTVLPEATLKNPLTSQMAIMRLRFWTTNERLHLWKAKATSFPPCTVAWSVCHLHSLPLQSTAEGGLREVLGIPFRKCYQWNVWDNQVGVLKRWHWPIYTQQVLERPMPLWLPRLWTLGHLWVISCEPNQGPIAHNRKWWNYMDRCLVSQGWKDQDVLLMQEIMAQWKEKVGHWAWTLCCSCFWAVILFPKVIFNGTLKQT
jgi:hypothetical protein